MLNYLLLVVGVVCGVVAWYFKGYRDLVKDIRRKSVFISGCDSGFGHGLALQLDRLGMKVYAGCLTEKGESDLKEQASSRLETILCDITKAEDITNVARVVAASSPDGLWGLVNNAGISLIGEWEWFPEKYLRQVMEINFFGHVAMTKALLPQIKKAKGRIVNVTSTNGYHTMIAMGGYSASKYAMEAFSDSLRLEMRKWGVSVFIVSPGPTRTTIQESGLRSGERIWSEASEELKREYGEDYAKRLLSVKLPPLDPPELVINALTSKLIHQNPTLRTRVGIIAKLAYVGVTFLPTSWFDFILFCGFRQARPASLFPKKLE